MCIIMFLIIKIVYVGILFSSALHPFLIERTNENITTARKTVVGKETNRAFL